MEVFLTAVVVTLALVCIFCTCTTICFYYCRSSTGSRNVVSHRAASNTQVSKSGIIVTPVPSSISIELTDKANEINGTATGDVPSSTTIEGNNVSTTNEPEWLYDSGTGIGSHPKIGKFV
jgi:hypothetical protein